MKKSLFIIWIVVSSLIVLFTAIELSIGISLWIKENTVPFWGPASITYIIILLLGISSLVLSIIFFKKFIKNKKH